MAYAFEKYNPGSMARAKGENLKISFKKTVEMGNFLKNKKIEEAISYLEKVIELKKAIPYKRFNTEMPHRKGKGIMAGGFPVNASKAVLILIKSAKNNADEKQLGDDLRIVNVSVREGPTRYHNGRHQGRKMKQTHVEVIVGVMKK